jgi:hypothetical protein
MAAAVSEQNSTANADFVQGIACALAALIRRHDLPGTAADIARSLGITPAMLRHAQVDDHDRKPLMEALRHG